MQRGLLKNFAHVLGQKFIGWCFMDLEQLSTLQSGELRIDALTARTFHNGQPIDSLNVSQEISAWFVSQVEQQDMDRSKLEHAHLIANFSSEEKLKRSGTRVITLDLVLRGEIAYDGKGYESEIREPHTFVAMGGAWYSPATEGPNPEPPS